MKARHILDRRTFVSGTALYSLAAGSAVLQGTPPRSGTHEFRDIREASMYYRTVQYDVTFDMESDPTTFHSWACGFLAHPASRSTYRQFPNMFEDGQVEFSLPGLPDMRAEMVERSDEIFGEDASLCAVTAPGSESDAGAFAICLNGALVQMLCVEPSQDSSATNAVDAVREIAGSIQARDPAFYGRGEMDREIVYQHVASREDLKLVYPHIRLREDRYVFTQDDGISDFWE